MESRKQKIGIDQSLVREKAEVDQSLMNSAGPGGLPILVIITTGDAEQNRQFFAENKAKRPQFLQKRVEGASGCQAKGAPSGYLISGEGKIASELAVGAEALLALANGKVERINVRRHPNPRAQAEGEGSDRAARFGNRSLARSKIKRDGLKAGTPAPNFRLPRLDGSELALEDLRGLRVFLVFSSPHCGPCNALAPELEKFHHEQPEVAIVMISRGDPKENRSKVKEHGLTFPVGLQQHYDISRRYAMFATPIAYF